MDPAVANLVESALSQSVISGRTTSSSDVRPPPPKKAKQGVQIQKWCMTLNNPSDQEITQLELYMKENCKYGVFEIEHQGGDGTPHIQGYLYLTSKKRLTQLKRVFARAHFEAAKGSHEQNVNYCSKEFRNNPEVRYFVHDAVTAEGENAEEAEEAKPSTTLEDALDKSKSLSEFMMNYPKLFCKYKNGVTAIMLQKEQLTAKEVPEVTWLWGETGTGKTRHCMQFCQTHNLEYWISGEKLNWFDGYMGQPVAILDDFRKGDCSFKFLLRLLDRYRLAVPIKGGHVQWVPKYIFITCPYEPRAYFQYTDAAGQQVEREDIGQLMRRITHIVHVGVPGAEQGQTQMQEPTDVLDGLLDPTYFE